jgi:hypothetical protein
MSDGGEDVQILPLQGQDYVEFRSARHAGSGGKTEYRRGQVLYRAEYRRALTLETGNSEEPRTCAEADQAVYATLTGADVMLLRLTETYEEIERRVGVKPLIVSEDTAFPAGLAVRMPSAFWQNDRACQVEVTVEKVKESRWIWGPLLRLRVDANTCIAPRGASGAPAACL